MGRRRVSAGFRSHRQQAAFWHLHAQSRSDREAMLARVGLSNHEVRPDAVPVTRTYTVRSQVIVTMGGTERIAEALAGVARSLGLMARSAEADMQRMQRAALRASRALEAAMGGAPFPCHVAVAEDP